MDIKSEDVAEVTEVGDLNGDKVKMIKTWGGLHVLVGKKDKASKKPDALAAASHKALAIHQLEKMYGNDFKPLMMKSESAQTESVLDFKPSRKMKKNHLEINSITKDSQVDFVISRFGIVLAKYECEIFKNELNLKKYKRVDNPLESLVKDAEDITETVRKAMVSYVKSNKLGFNVGNQS